MKRLLIASSGFSHGEVREAFLASLGENPATLAAAIITTAPKDKEKNRWAIATRDTFIAMGFARADFIDVEFDPAERLRDYGVIYINGGDPFHLLHHLRCSGADRLLIELAEAGRFLIGTSGGGLVLGPSIALVHAVDPGMNLVGLVDFRALGLTQWVLLPHRTLLMQRYPDLEARVTEFQKEMSGRLLILEDGEAMLLLGDTEAKIPNSLITGMRAHYP